MTSTIEFVEVFEECDGANSSQHCIESVVEQFMKFGDLTRERITGTVLKPGNCKTSGVAANHCCALQ